MSLVYYLWWNWKFIAITFNDVSLITQEGHTLLEMTRSAGLPQKKKHSLFCVLEIIKILKAGKPSPEIWDEVKSALNLTPLMHESKGKVNIPPPGHTWGIWLIGISGSREFDLPSREGGEFDMEGWGIWTVSVQTCAAHKRDSQTFTAAIITKNSCS